jgi:hypothetical protein
VAERHGSAHRGPPSRGVPAHRIDCPVPTPGRSGRRARPDGPTVESAGRPSAAVGRRRSHTACGRGTGVGTRVWRRHGVCGLAGTRVRRPEGVCRPPAPSPSTSAPSRRSPEPPQPRAAASPEPPPAASRRSPEPPPAPSRRGHGLPRPRSGAGSTRRLVVRSRTGRRAPPTRGAVRRADPRSHHHRRPAHPARTPDRPAARGDRTRAGSRRSRRRGRRTR